MSLDQSVSQYLMQPIPTWEVLALSIWWYWLGKQHGKGLR